MYYYHQRRKKKKQQKQLYSEEEEEENDFKTSSAQSPTVQPFLRGTKKPHIDYDRYLSGRPFQLFKSAIRSEKTLHIYKYGLWRFCDFLKMNTQEIVSKYRYSSDDDDGYDSANGNNISNNNSNN
jgi:hypothetical protein